MKFTMHRLLRLILILCLVRPSYSAPNPVRFPTEGGVLASGSHNKFINLVVRNNYGTGLFVDDKAKNIEVRGSLIVNNGDSYRDHSVAVAERPTDVNFNNNIIANAHPSARGFYAEGAGLQLGRLSLLHNTFINSRLVSGDLSSSRLVSWVGNRFFNSSLQFGGTQVSDDAQFDKNIFVYGALQARGFRQLSFQNNVVVSSISTHAFYLSPPDATSLSDYQLQQNTYHETTLFGDGEGPLNFSSWQNKGWDQTGSQYNVSKKTGVSAFLTTNADQPGRAHLAVYNWDKLDRVTLNLSEAVETGEPIPLENGKRYEIRSALDFLGSTQFVEVAQGRITVDMRPKSAAYPEGWSVAIPSRHSASFGGQTLPVFGSFIILPLDSSTPRPPTFTTLQSPTIYPLGRLIAPTQAISLVSAQAGVEIRYTLDGSIPVATSPLYTKPFFLAASSPVKARSFQSGYEPSPAVSADFVIQSNLSEGLVAHYSFDEGNGTVLKDMSGHERHANFKNNPTWHSDGASGGALNFDGVDDSVELPDMASAFQTGKLTYSMWLRRKGVKPSPWPAISNTNSQHFRVADSTFYRMQALLTDKTSQVQCQATSLHGLPMNEWVFAAMVYDGSQVKVYMNDLEPVVSASCPDVVPAEPLRAIGRSLTHNHFFLGDIDDMRLYNRALSSEEIRVLFGARSNKYPQPPVNTQAIRQENFWFVPGTYVARDSRTQISQVSNEWPGAQVKADQIKGVNSSYLLMDQAPYRAVNGQLLQPFSPQPALRFGYGTQVIDLKFENLRAGVYGLRLVGRVTTSPVPRIRPPVYVHLRINDGPQGQVNEYQMKVNYEDALNEVGRVFFYGLNERNTLDAKLFIGAGSREELLLHRIDFLTL
jgi:hypothetical protein